MDERGRTERQLTAAACGLAADGFYPPHSLDNWLWSCAIIVARALYRACGQDPRIESTADDDGNVALDAKRQK